MKKAAHCLHLLYYLIGLPISTGAVLQTAEVEKPIVKYLQHLKHTANLKKKCVLITIYKVAHSKLTKNKNKLVDI